MNIELKVTKGRSSVTQEIQVDNLVDEENLQEAIAGFLDFLVAAGADLPDEIIDMLDDYYDGSN